MDLRTRQGQILIEALMIIFLFVVMLLIFESEMKPQVLKNSTKRWERTRP